MQDSTEHRVLEHVGEIAGVKLMLVIHERLSSASNNGCRGAAHITAASRQARDVKLLIRRAPPALQFYGRDRSVARFRRSREMKSPCPGTPAPRSASCRRMKPPLPCAKAPDWLSRKPPRSFLEGPRL